MSSGGAKGLQGRREQHRVYSINQTTGEPTPIQHIETGGIHPRTFQIDQSAHSDRAAQPSGASEGWHSVRVVTAGLSMFRIGDDGKLTFVRKYDIDVAGKDDVVVSMVAL